MDSGNDCKQHVQNNTSCLGVNPCLQCLSQKQQSAEWCAKWGRPNDIPKIARQFHKPSPNVWILALGFPTLLVYPSNLNKHCKQTLSADGTPTYPGFVQKSALICLHPPIPDGYASQRTLTCCWTQAQWVTCIWPTKIVEPPYGSGLYVVVMVYHSKGFGSEIGTPYTS